MKGRLGRDRMAVGFTTTLQSVHISTNFVSSNPIHGELYSIQHYMRKFVIDLQQFGGFFCLLRFSPPIKLTAMI